jgi:hypothetical protein
MIDTNVKVTSENHIHEGKKVAVGAIIKVDQGTAKWLRDQGVADYVKAPVAPETKADESRPKNIGDKSTK